MPRHLALGVLLLQFLLPTLTVSGGFAAAAAAPFGVQVVDDRSGRGVPCVRLETTSRQRYYTDSGGYAAIGDPALMGQKVFFTVTSFGYEFPADAFGIHGTALDVKPGGSATLKIKRTNIAERLYRTTGEGIYRDTVMLGKKPPIAQPLLNAQVVGQDSVQSAIYRGKIYFFWGDTAKLSYPLGLFKMAGATADLPGKGGLDPAVGVNYHYFTDASGFARAMVPRPEKEPVWVDGVIVVKDDAGQERMLAHASLQQGLVRTLERYLILWDDKTNTFNKLKTIDLDAPLAPTGHPFRVSVSGKDYFYFPAPYPAVRVPATFQAVQDLHQYEGYTCLKPGARYDKQGATLDRTAGGKLNWAWKKNTPSLSPKQLAELVDAKKVKREDLPFRLQDADTGKPILLHGGSVNYNAYRKKYVMIALEGGGASMVGEVYYAEAAQPEGPWVSARKIVTHDMEADGVLGKQHERMDFYNPMQHAFFDQDGGRVIYFEGTYTNTFSGNPTPTPRYEYNNQMYRLDLSDPALKLP